MAIRIDERFVVRAPVEAVWSFLVDPRRVVTCVPGGELGDVIDEQTFHGKVRVKVGPVTLAYGGRVQLAEVDVAARRVRIVGVARETAGTDSARMTLDSWLTALPGGGTEVVAHARMDVAGRIAELGRGVLEQLAHVVFQEFASRAAASIEAGSAPVWSAGSPSPAQEPLRAVPLALRALRAWVAGIFRPARGRMPRSLTVTPGNASHRGTLE